MAGLELYAPRRLKHRRTWSVAAVVLAAVFMILGQLLAAIPGLLTGLISMTGELIGWGGDAYLLIVGFGLTAALVLAWVLLFERRGLATIGLNSRGAMRFGRGYAIGLAFLLATVGIVWAAGGYRIESGGAFLAASIPAAMLPIGVMLIGFVIQGSTEEIVFRGWLMQVIASRHGVVVALIVNAGLFGLAHGANTAPTKELALGVVNIVLFGTFIGLYAMREGSLWGVCGWHAAWNWLLGLGFGLEVSGQVVKTTPLVVDLTTRPDAAWWLTGATFGPEASVVTTAILLVGSLVLILRGRVKGYPVETPFPATVPAASVADLPTRDPDTSIGTTR